MKTHSQYLFTSRVQYVQYRSERLEVAANFSELQRQYLTVKSGIRNRDLLLRKILKRRVDQNQTSFYSLVQGKLARCGAASIWQHYCIRLDQEHRIIADPISNSNEIPSLVSVFLMRVRY